MKTSTRKILKYTGLAFAGLVVLIIGFGIYIYSILPKAIGTPIQLQPSLFAKPAIINYTNKSFIYAPAGELAALIKTKKATSFEITAAHLAQIRNFNYRYNG